MSKIEQIVCRHFLSPVPYVVVVFFSRRVPIPYVYRPPTHIRTRTIFVVFKILSKHAVVWLRNREFKYSTFYVSTTPLIAKFKGNRPCIARVEF